MARTTLFSFVQRALRRAHAAQHLGARPAELARAATARGPSRRQVLAGLAAAPLVVACRPLLRGDRAPQVAIVGAGLAGLHAGYRLRQAGVRATIYDAATRVGGRMFTARGQLAGGQLCELGGELIDSGHITMHALARELGLPLDDLTADAAGLVADTCRFDGKLVSEAELVAELATIAPQLVADAAAQDRDAAALARLDALSISGWLATVARLPETSVARRLLEVAYTIEFGLPADELSSINLLAMFDATDLEPLRIFGDSDERYHVHGGSDAITTALAERLPDQLALQHTLARVAPAGPGTDALALQFDTPSGAIEVTADYVILALPFSTLRTVDLVSLPLPAAKRQVIAELGYGTNAKLMMQFERRVWRELGATGSAYTTDSPLQATWDTSRGQPGAYGVLTNYTGGARGLAIGAGTAEERAREVVPWIDAVFPGAEAAYRPGSALRMHWPTHALTRGSYACYRVGQARWAGLEAEPAGRVHFAGEHTSVEAQGYMEGAAESGARAAREIVAALGR
jgi:monoamine oxidase